MREHQKSYINRLTFDLTACGDEADVVEMNTRFV